MLPRPLLTSPVGQRYHCQGADNNGDNEVNDQMTLFHRTMLSDGPLQQEVASGLLRALSSSFRASRPTSDICVLGGVSSWLMRLGCGTVILKTARGSSSYRYPDWAE